MTWDAQLDGRKVLVVGLGKSGESAARFLLGRGAAVLVTDAGRSPILEERAGRLAAAGARIELGTHRPESFVEQDLIVISPGVPPDLPGLVAARNSGVPITGEIELAARFIAVPMICITGTNGKSTVTTLIGRMLEAAGRKVFLGGNLGRPLIELAEDPAGTDAAVVELSSFQLETAEALHPAVGVLLNLTPDHLDRYPGLAAYYATKARLFRNMTDRDTAVLNADDPEIQKLDVNGRRRMFSRKGPVENGAWLDGGRIVVMEAGRRIGEGDFDALTLAGAHNQENVMAAWLAAVSAGASLDAAWNAAREFTGLPHRVEFVAEIDGVRYYDDSKGTNVGAVLKSLEGFSEPVILVAGGLGKDQDFSPLAEPVRRGVRLLILLGRDRERMARALDGCTEVALADDMAQAVALAGERARPGEVVLLSPLAPAWTCSRIMRTAAACSRNWRGGCGHEFRHGHGHARHRLRAAAHTAFAWSAWGWRCCCPPARPWPRPSMTIRTFSSGPSSCSPWPDWRPCWC